MMRTAKRETSVPPEVCKPAAPSRLSGQGAPTSLSSGSTTSFPSASWLHPMSCAKHSMPNESTPLSVRRSILRPLPGVVMPTGCRGRRRRGFRGSCSEKAFLPRSSLRGHSLSFPAPYPTALTHREDNFHSLLDVGSICYDLEGSTMDERGR